MKKRFMTKYEYEREKIHKQYKDKILSLQAELKSIKEENAALRVKVSEYEVQIEVLKDWTERMQEYMNLSDEDLKKLIKSSEAKEKLVGLFSGFDRFSRWL